MDIVDRAEKNVGIIIPGSHRSAFQDRHTGSGRHFNGGACAESEDPRCADDGMGRGDVDTAAGIKALNSAALVGGDAVNLGTVADHDIISGAAIDVDFDALIANDRSGHQQLLAQVNLDPVGMHPGVGRAEGVLDILAEYLHQTCIEVQCVAGLNVSHHVDTIGDKGCLISQLGFEGENADGLVLDIADTHDHVFSIVTDRYRLEPVF